MKLLARLNAAVAVVLFAALVGVVSLQVVSRFLLHIPVIWSEEVARFLFLWVALLGAALSVRNRRHFVIDVAPGAGRGGGAGRFLLDVLPDLCVLAFSLFLLWQGTGYARAGAFRTATNSQVSMALVYAAIPVFALLSALYAGGALVRDGRQFLRGRAAGERPPAPAE